jgi:hypothetical protein
MTRPATKPEHYCMACGVGLGPWETAVVPDKTKAEYLCVPCYAATTAMRRAA